MKVILDAFDAGPVLRVTFRTLVWPFQWLGYKGDVTMPPATRALTALGPAYIKFGQVLSTRPDVVGDELAVQLRVLQDKLPPFSMQDAEKEVQRELGSPASELFSSFSEPVAAASLAQVHKALLADTGEAVAVKILRPGIERAFRKDIDAFYFAARAIELLSPSSRRLRPMEVIRHFESIVVGELDLRLESSAASEFATNTENDAGFHVPRIRWHLSGRRAFCRCS
jgi:ubiquinone biosynthesis protein